jgi:inosine-uridine nucleoside N-ribohydrolase
MPPESSIVMDSDIGGDVDDALALVLAATSPEVDLRLVTTVGGKPALSGRRHAEQRRAADERLAA